MGSGYLLVILKQSCLQLPDVGGKPEKKPEQRGKKNAKPMLVLERINALSTSLNIKHLSHLEPAFPQSSLLRQPLSAATILSTLRNAWG